MLVQLRDQQKLNQLRTNESCKRYRRAEMS